MLYGTDVPSKMAATTTINGYNGVDITAYIHEPFSFVKHIKSRLASSAVPLLICRCSTCYGGLITNRGGRAFIPKRAAGTVCPTPRPPSVASRPWASGSRAGMGGAPSGRVLWSKGKLRAGSSSVGTWANPRARPRGCCSGLQAGASQMRKR